MKQLFPRCLSMLLIMLLLCISVVGCDLQQSAHAPSPSVESNKTALTSPSGQHASLSLTAAEKEEVNIIFMGNSITQTGNLPLHFTYLAPSRNIKVTEMSKGGYALSHHVSRLNSIQQDDDAFRHIDIVVLQEGGGYYPHYFNTYELMSIIGPDKTYYAFTSMLRGVNDWPYLQESYSSLNLNLVVVPILQYATGLDEMDFVLPDKLHPTSLYGYVVALTLYCKIFDVKPTEQNNGCLTAYDIPGATAKEDAAYMTELKKAVQRMLDDQKSSDTI